MLYFMQDVNKYMVDQEYTKRGYGTGVFTLCKSKWSKQRLCLRQKIMISILNKNNQLGEQKNSLRITYPRTVDIIFGTIRTLMLCIILF